MKKTLLVVVTLSIITLIIGVTTHVSALTDTYSDNITRISTDNFTLSINGLTGALNEAATTHANIISAGENTITDKLIGFAILALVILIAAWRRTWLFYAPAGFAWLIYGFGYWTTSNYLSVIMVIVGLVCFAGAKWDRQ